MIGIDCVHIFKSFESGPNYRPSYSLVRHFRSLSALQVVNSSIGATNSLMQAQALAWCSTKNITWHVSLGRVCIGHEIILIIIFDGQRSLTLYISSIPGTRRHVRGMQVHGRRQDQVPPILQLLSLIHSVFEREIHSQIPVISTMPETGRTTISSLTVFAVVL